MLLYESKEDGTATNINHIVAYMKDAIRNNAYNYTETAIKQLYKYQTAFEQNRQSTFEHNGVGFNAKDATLLSSFAERLLNNEHLTTKQLDTAKVKVQKYAKQLVNMYIQLGIITKVRNGLYKWTPRAKRDKLKIVQKRQNEELPNKQYDSNDLYDQY